MTQQNENKHNCAPDGIRFASGMMHDVKPENGGGIPTQKMRVLVGVNGWVTVKSDDASLIIHTQVQRDQETGDDLVRFDIKGVAYRIEATEFCERCNSAVDAEDEFYQCANEKCARMVCGGCANHNEFDGLRAGALHVVNRSCLCLDCYAAAEESANAEERRRARERAGAEMK